MSLVLELRQGEIMIVNGAPLRFRTRTRIEMTAQARFMFGKQIMAPDQAHTPARRIYFALQTAYIGRESERAAGLEAARHFIGEFQEATTSDLARSLLTEALIAAEEDDCYQALKLGRQIIQHEDAVSEQNPVPGSERSGYFVIAPASPCTHVNNHVNPIGCHRLTKTRIKRSQE